MKKNKSRRLSVNEEGKKQKHDEAAEEEKEDQQ